MCRGLITKGDGTIVARPFGKFFNLEEHKEILPDGRFKVFDKMDGSLGILYWIDDVPYISTRGSMTSDQAKKGTEILHTEYFKKKWHLFNRKKTYLFEIIYPENRIVVNYEKTENLFLLAVIDTRTGKDDWKEWEKLNFGEEPIYHTDWYGNCTWSSFEALKMLRKNDDCEGFVLIWPNGLRLKVKYDEYKRLHKLITGVNERRIWEIMASGDSLKDMLEKVPDEFYQFVKKTSKRLTDQFRSYEDDIHYTVLKVRDIPSRKEQAIIISKSKCPSGAFALLDGKDYGKMIWQLIRPEATKPYKVADL